METFNSRKKGFDMSCVWKIQEICNNIVKWATFLNTLLVQTCELTPPSSILNDFLKNQLKPAIWYVTPKCITTSFSFMLYCFPMHYFPVQRYRLYKIYLITWPTQLCHVLPSTPLNSPTCFITSTVGFDLLIINSLRIVQLLNIFLYTILNCQSLPFFLLNWNMSQYFPAHSVWVG